MVLPHLLRFVWPMIVTGIVVLIVSLVFLTILIPELGMLKNRPILRLMIWVFPFAYPALGSALFSWAADHDDRVRKQLSATGVTATATVTAVRDIVIGKKIFSVLGVSIRVTPPEAEPFNTELALDPTESPVGAPTSGMGVRVRYDPHDRSRLMLVR